jgi:quercetin dioxygenase-like cupin family protein
MKSEIAGITRANEGMQGISWNILGQTYVPKNCTEHSFSWHATLPPGTFVPPHIHPDQDEYLYILEGKLDFMLGGGEAQATPGDLVRLAMPQAVRSVLGPSQHEGAEARGRGGDGRRIQHPLPAAAAGGVSRRAPHRSPSW